MMFVSAPVWHMRRREFVSLLGGALVAAPNIARSQPGKKIPTVAHLWHAGNAKEETPYYEALIEGFSNLGYIDGRNFRLLHRFPNEEPERFRSMAAELVSLNVDVLMGGAIASAYLRDATKAIPIVFMFIPDPVGMKFVQSLARPGGNATGLTNFGSDIAGKRLQLFKELVPGLHRVGLLVTPNNEVSQLTAKVILAAGDQLGLQLRTFEASSLNEVEPALDAMAKAGMQGLILAQSGIGFQARHIIPKVALALGLPMCAYSKETFEHGALLSYAADNIEMCRHSAVYADKILKGAKPGEIPIEQPTKLELLINLKTAKALGLQVPIHIQQIADQVIE
jgi:putative tryptophan/tyrosine transport system substrate-binding protein